MDLVDEEDVVLLEVGEDRRQVLGLLEHRARGRAQVDAELVGDDVASVVLPRPGGPNSSTWSIASPRIRAAPMKISSCSRALAWPTYSARPLGRSARSIASSPGEPDAAATTAEAAARRPGREIVGLDDHGGIIECRLAVGSRPEGPQWRWPAAAASPLARRGGAHRHFQSRDAGSTGAIDELEDERHGLADDQGLLQVHQHQVVAAGFELHRLARRQIEPAAMARIRITSPSIFISWTSARPATGVETPTRRAPEARPAS